jgi:hypothetical protein
MPIRLKLAYISSLLISHALVTTVLHLVVTALVPPPPYVGRYQSLAFLADFVIYLHMATMNIHPRSIAKMLTR